MQDLNCPKREKVVFINIDNLGVDKCNIRQGIWDCDKELIKSVRNRGVIEPLIVRPTPLGTDKKYGTVCGSRRYNAAVEAGLDKVPCLVRSMTDMEAMELSMIENRMRKDTPAWMDIEYIGMMYRKYSTDELLLDSDPVKKISKTGISRATVEKYIGIFNLPMEIKGLLREPGERTKMQKEYLKQFQWRETKNILFIGHAELLTKLKRLPLERQMEVALFILNKSFEIAKRIVNNVRVHVDRDISDIYEEIHDKLGMVRRVVQLDRETSEALKDACMDKQVPWDELIPKIIKRWLKKHEYLGSRDLFNRGK